MYVRNKIGPWENIYSYIQYCCPTLYVLRVGTFTGEAGGFEPELHTLHNNLASRTLCCIEDINTQSLGHIVVLSRSAPPPPPSLPKKT
jgi:hypothetical protein